jgi:transcriptional regulator with XRE-family HTH domain
VRRTAIVVSATAAPIPLGARLRAARQRQWLSQQDVARLTGITQAAYSQIERGQVRPRPERIRRLSIVLALDPTELLPLAGYDPDTITLPVAVSPAVGA